MLSPTKKSKKLASKKLARLEIKNLQYIVSTKTNIKKVINLWKFSKIYIYINQLKLVE